MKRIILALTMLVAITATASAQAEIKFEKLNGDVTIYTNKVIEKKNSTEVGIEWGYYYESATQQLWYINSDKSEMSLVCDNVTSFDVRISKDSIELDTATIKSIDRNPQIVISLGLQRMNEKRIVSRTFSTRNWKLLKPPYW